MRLSERTINLSLCKYSAHHCTAGTVFLLSYNTIKKLAPLVGIPPLPPSPREPFENSIGVCVRGVKIGLPSFFQRFFSGSLRLR